MSKIKNEKIDWEKVADYLEGTCKPIESAIDKFNLNCEPDDVEEAMLDENLERCHYCDWWMESSELVDESGEVVGCDQCRSKYEE